MPQHVYHYTEREHNEAVACRDLVDYLIRFKSDRDSSTAAAETFMRYFDPERSDEAGHIAFCFTLALDDLMKRGSV